MELLGYSLVNEDKVERAINGTLAGNGALSGGVKKETDEEGNITNGAEIIAEYDRLGGFIKKGSYKVKTGSFYDFKANKPRAKAEITYVLKGQNDTIVEYKESDADGSPIPLELRALQEAPKEEGVEVVVKKGKKVKIKKDKNAQPDEELEIEE